MRFRWTAGQGVGEAGYRFCLDLEYKLRSRITRFLIDRLDQEELPDFSNFIFDVDLCNSRVSLSPETRTLLDPHFCMAFDREINLGFARPLLNRSPFNAA